MILKTSYRTKLYDCIQWFAIASNHRMGVVRNSDLERSKRKVQLINGRYVSADTNFSERVYSEV